jgi:hypothetical protein
LNIEPDFSIDEIKPNRKQGKKQETQEDTDIVRFRVSLQQLSFDRLLQELGKMKLKLGVIIPVIFEKGKQKGLKEIEIRDIINKTIDIPGRTLIPYLPEGAKKHKYPKNRELAKLANYNEITEDSTSTKASNSERVPDVLPRLTRTSECVYRNWTLDELISGYEAIELENENLDLQLTEANTRIEKLEEYLEEQGLMIDD